MNISWIGWRSETSQLPPTHSFALKGQISSRTALSSIQLSLPIARAQVENYYTISRDKEWSFPSRTSLLRKVASGSELSFQQWKMFAAEQRTKKLENLFSFPWSELLCEIIIHWWKGAEIQKLRHSPSLFNPSCLDETSILIRNLL